MGSKHIKYLKALNNFAIPRSKIVSRIQARIDAFTVKYRLILTNSLAVTGNISCDFRV